MDQANSEQVDENDGSFRCRVFFNFVVVLSFDGFVERWEVVKSDGSADERSVVFVAHGEECVDVGDGGDRLGLDEGGGLDESEE